MVKHPRGSHYQAGLCSTTFQIQYGDHHYGHNGAQRAKMAPQIGEIVGKKS